MYTYSDLYSDKGLALWYIKVLIMHLRDCALTSRVKTEIQFALKRRTGHKGC